jgi:hypothetical protein
MKTFEIISIGTLERTRKALIEAQELLAEYVKALGLRVQTERAATAISTALRELHAESNALRLNILAREGYEVDLDGDNVILHEGKDRSAE